MYNEGLYSDTYVHSRLTQQELMRRRLMLAACVVLPVLALVVLPGVLKILGLLASVVIDIILIYFLPNPHIDFEYVFVDGQIDFDRIIAENARKNMCRTDLEKAEAACDQFKEILEELNLAISSM